MREKKTQGEVFGMVELRAQQAGLCCMDLTGIVKCGLGVDTL